MPDVLLFGATGYTGRLTAQALERRGASFAIAGRSAEKLESLARETGDPPVHIASVGDVDALTRALEGSKVLITTVGPFTELGDTAVQAALNAGVHYIDSTGEGPFIQRLIDEHDAAARSAGIAIAPAMGFDEVPADVAATLAAEDLEQPAITLTYALPTNASSGTLRSVPGILMSTGPWLEDGKRRTIRAGQETRWAPMPPPLGPRLSMSFPIAEGRLGPLHLNVTGFRTFVTTGSAQRTMARFLTPAMSVAMKIPGADSAMKMVLPKGNDGPDEDKRARSKWTILAEARSGREWRNVSLQGTDPYGLTAEFLTTAALTMADDSYDRSGVMAPAQAVDVDIWRKELDQQGVQIETYEPT
jgi:short subunit dehydrogenase-like uncharacterized protein